VKKIPPFKLVPEPMNEQARGLPKFKWAGPVIGTRHQLGGEPTFIQRANWPECQCCGKEMTFYGQLDSINDEFCIADCGLVFVFICFGCYEATSFVQSY
jgi:hypothetical protein